MAIPAFATGDVPTSSQILTWFVNIVFASKASDTGRASTTTLADDPDLSIAVSANATYHVLVLLRHNSQPAGDLKYTFTAPAGASFDRVDETLSTSAALFTDDQLFGAALGDVLTSGGIAGVNVPIRCEGLLITSGTAGNFKLQWAQGTSNAGNSTLRASSFIRAWRIS